MTELYHYGIKGMRWGIRRSPEELGHIRDINNNVRTVSNDTANLIRSYGKKRSTSEDVSKISDDELKRRVARLGLERQYKSLTAPEISKGAEKTAKILTGIGTVAGIGASAMSIAIAIKQLRKD